MTRNTFAFAYGASALLTFVALGCKSDDPPPTIASFCDKKAERECGTATKGMAANCGADLAACKVARAAACVMWASAQQSPTRPIRADNIDNCLSKTSDAYAGTIVTPDKLAVMDDACNRVFSGNIPAGSALACQSNYDCANGVICDQAYCVKKAAPGVNNFCSDPGTVCPANYYCAPAGALKKCMPSKQAGEACGVGIPCIDTLRCGSAGTCVPRATINMACGSNADCAVEAPYCDPYSDCSCRPGFQPTPMTSECVTFGSTKVTGSPMVCTGTPGGAAGAPGTSGAAGAAGSAGTAGAGGGGGAGGEAGAGGAG